jgi:hypothetical protein
MHSDYTKKTKEIAEVRRALDPIRDEIAKAEVTEGEAVKNMVAAHLVLQNNPDIGIQYLAMAYGFSLEDINDNWKSPEEFTRNIKEKGKVTRLESELEGRKTREQQESYEKQVAEIEEFKKDHPHFDDVEPQMKELAAAALVAGEEKPKLEELYEKALWLNPEVREKMMNGQKPKTGKSVKSAKKASTRVKTTPKNKREKPKGDLSLLDELSQGWDKMVSDA